jgi:Rieske Fe-S protein
VEPAGPQDLRTGDPADAAMAPGDQRAAADLSRPRDLTPAPPDLSSTGAGDMACGGGIPVPAAYMPGLDETKFWKAHRVFIARDAKGYMAIWSSCQHAGCDVVELRGGTQTYICPCHGSTFTFDGSLIEGLSPSSLYHMGLCWQDATKQVLLLDPRMLIDDTDQRAPE